MSATALQAQEVPESKRCDAGQQLVLNEVWSRTLPAGFIPSDAAILDRDVILSMPRSPYVLVVDSMTETFISNVVFTRPAAVAVREGGELIEVLDLGRASATTFSRDGRVRREREVAVPSEIAAMNIDDAALLSTGWTVAGRDSLGHFYVSSVENGRYLEISASPGRRPLSGYLSRGSDDALILTFAHYPFNVYVISDGAIVMRMSPAIPAVDSVQASVDGQNAWASLNTVQIDNGYIQVLTDLESDRRILVRYGSEGRQVKAVTLNAPIGLMATRIRDRYAVGIRDVGGGLEAVLYEWCWSGGV